MSGEGYPRFPVVEYSKPVFHVGNLIPLQDLPRPPTLSYEANALSVSHHPDVWSRIARLSGDTYMLSKPDAKWLLARETLSSPELVSSLAEWATNNQLLVRGVIHFVWELDPETNEKRIFEFADRSEAMEFLRDSGATDQEVGEREGWLATKELQRQTNYAVDVPPVLALHFALMRYAEAILCADGVWWTDRLDPSNFSAPRGAIFRPSDWSIAPAQNLNLAQRQSIDL